MWSHLHGKLCPPVPSPQDYHLLIMTRKSTRGELTHFPATGTCNPITFISTKPKVEKPGGVSGVNTASAPLHSNSMMGVQRPHQTSCSLLPFKLTPEGEGRQQPHGCPTAAPRLCSSCRSAPLSWAGGERLDSAHQLCLARVLRKAGFQQHTPTVLLAWVKRLAQLLEYLQADICFVDFSALLSL